MDVVIRTTYREGLHLILAGNASEVCPESWA